MAKIIVHVSKKGSIKKNSSFPSVILDGCKCKISVTHSETSNLSNLKRLHFEYTL